MERGARAGKAAGGLAGSEGQVARRGLSRRAREKLLGYSLVSPAALLIAIFIVYPIIYNIYLSFRNVNLLKPTSRFVGFATYLKVLRDPVFHEVFRNSLEWIVLGTIGAVVVGSLVGLFLALNFKGKGVLLALVLVPWVVPDVVVGSAFKWMYHSEMGVFSYILMSLGILEQPYPFLAKAATVLPTATTVIIWRLSPFFCLMFLAGLQSIPGVLYEAASMDGAGTLRRFRHITLPMMGYPLVIGSLLTMIFIMNNLTIMLIMTRGGPLHFSEIFPTYIYKAAFQNWDTSKAAAASMINFVLLLIVSLAYLRLFRRQWREAA